MIRDIEILNEIITIRKKTELLANPLYNDAGGSTVWNAIDKRLKSIIKDIETDLQYHLIKINN